MSKEIEEIERLRAGFNEEDPPVGLIIHRETFFFIMTKISTLEERITEQDHINIGLVESLSNALDDFGKSQEKVKEQQKQIDFQIKNYLADHNLMTEYRSKWEQAESRIKELESENIYLSERLQDWEIQYKELKEKISRL